MKYLVCACILLLISCNQESDNLVGHWHILCDPAYGDTCRLEFRVLDILDDTAGYLGSNRGVYYASLGGYIDRHAHTMIFGGECIMIEFKYHFDGSILHFADISYGHEDYYLAERCDSSCCDQQKDFFWSYKGEIDLPVTNTATNKIPMDSKALSLCCEMAFGIPRPNYQSEYGNKPRLLLGPGFQSLDKLELWSEKHFIKISENLRSEVYYAVFPDKTTPVGHLNQLYLKLKSMDVDTVYIASREPDVHHLKIWYTPIALDSFAIDTSSTVTVAQWLSAM